jgi:hypothetical protein
MTVIAGLGTVATVLLASPASSCVARSSQKTCVSPYSRYFWKQLKICASVSFEENSHDDAGE